MHTTQHHMHWWYQCDVHEGHSFKSNFQTEEQIHRPSTSRQHHIVSMRMQRKLDNNPLMVMVVSVPAKPDWTYQEWVESWLSHTKYQTLTSSWMAVTSYHYSPMTSSAPNSGPNSECSTITYSLFWIFVQIIVQKSTLWVCLVSRGKGKIQSSCQYLVNNTIISLSQTPPIW